MYEEQFCRCAQMRPTQPTARLFSRSEFQHSQSKLRSDGLLSLATTLDDFLKGPHRQNESCAAFQANPLALFPSAQLPVDAFTGRSDHVAEIILGDGNLALTRIPPPPERRSNALASRPGKARN